MKSFNLIEQMASIIFLSLYVPILALSLIPGILCVMFSIEITESYSTFTTVVTISLAASIAYFLHQIAVPRERS